MLLPQPLEAMTEACSEFLKRNVEDCVICSTVKKEAFDLIERSYSVIAINLRESLKPFLETEGIKKLNNRSGRILANFFSERKKSLHFRRSNLPAEMLGTIENYVASKIHSLKDGQEIPADDFLAAVTTELAADKHELEAPFKTIRTLEIEPNNKIVSCVIVAIVLDNPDDARHLASALEYQYAQNKWVVFVTYDEQHILGRGRDIHQIFALQCSKPEWALDHYRHMTRMKPPVECFCELSSYSNKQREFGETLEKTKGIKIIAYSDE